MIGICIVNYNTRDLLKRSLDLLAIENRNYGLYVADNGSTDGSVELLKEYSTIYEGQEEYNPGLLDKIYYNNNIGYARACNQLGTNSTGDIIGLLNADVWLTPDQVQMIQDQFDNHPEIAVLGPKQRNEEGYIVHAGIFGPNTAPKHRGWKMHDPGDVLFRTLDEAVTISGSAYFIRRSVWEELEECDCESGVMPSNSVYSGAFLLTKHYY